MRYVGIDQHGECDYLVTWIIGAQAPKSRLFDSRDAAESFANNKAGKSGLVVSTLDMTAAQLAKLRAKVCPVCADSACETKSLDCGK